MPREWLAIAKVEFLLSTERIRRARKSALIGLLLGVIIWVSTIAFRLLDIVFGQFLPALSILIASDPSSMVRAVTMMLWLLFFAFPISKAVQEMKIAQCEILLSTGTSTRSILFGQWLGKVPVYFFLVMGLSPLLISPVISTFQVQWEGVLAIYASVLVTTFPALWISDILASTVRGRLAQSSRGDAIAKVISVLTALILIVPVILFLYLPDLLNQSMKSELVIFLPFTWGADLVTWSVLLFSGVLLSPAQLEAFESVLVSSAQGCAVLMLAFALLSLVAGALAADRVFTFDLGARTEIVRTVRKENRFFRGIRRVFGWPTGALVVVAMKDFFRKTANIVRYCYALVLGTIPGFVVQIVVTSMGGLDSQTMSLIPRVIFLLAVMAVTMVYPTVAVASFSGTGFLESRNHLWVFKTTPRGSDKLVHARLMAMVILSLPLAVLPAVATWLLGLSIPLSLTIFGQALLLVWGSTLTGIGVTAINPTYEDQHSSMYKLNIISALVVVMVFSLGLPVAVISSGWLGTDPSYAFFLFGSLPLTLSGLLIFQIGIRSLGRPEK